MDITAAAGRTTREQMLAGELHLAPDPELIALGNRARERLRAFNDTPRERAEDRAAILHRLFARFGRSWIESPFSVDYGVHVAIGEFLLRQHELHLSRQRADHHR
jgi:maltose O-acetyltransferase